MFNNISAELLAILTIVLIVYVANRIARRHIQKRSVSHLGLRLDEESDLKRTKLSVHEFVFAPTGIIDMIPPGWSIKDGKYLLDEKTHYRGEINGNLLKIHPRFTLMRTVNAEGLKVHVLDIHNDCSTASFSGSTYEEAEAKARKWLDSNHPDWDY